MNKTSPVFEKLKRDGQVAVIYSPGFGAGWWTWNRNHEGLVFDKDIAEAVIAKDLSKAANIVAAKYPDTYLGGLDDLEVIWVDEGSQFEIDEYDGSESVHVIGHRVYFTA